MSTILIQPYYACSCQLLPSLVVKAVHRHRTGVGSIPAGEPIVVEFFSTVPGWNFDMCMIST